MPYPTGRAAHLDVPLSNFASAAFAAGSEGFIAEDFMPVVQVAKQSDRYYIIDKGDFFSIPDTYRAPKTIAKRVTFRVSSDSYYAENYALGGENALEDLSNADTAVMLRENTVNLVVTDLRRDQERRIARMVTSISNVGSGVALTGTSKWSDYSNSDPLGDINSAASFIEGRTGLVPNTAVIDKDTLRVLRRHPVLLDMYKYTSGGQLTNAQLAEIFDVERVLIPNALVENVSELVTQTSSLTRVWGNCFILAHNAPATGLQSRTWGARFRWRNPIWPGDFGVKTDTFDRAGEEHVEIVEAGYFQDEKIIARDLIYAIMNTL